MPRYYSIQNSFTGGEISPRLLGRTDTNQYKNSVSEMVNCYPFLHGGVTRRKGSKHIGKLDSHNSYSPKLMKFVFSRTESYLLIIHNSVMYFVKNGAFIENAGVKVKLSVPYLDSELKELRYSQQGNVMIITHSNHPPYRLSRISDTNWTLSSIDFVHYAVTDQWYRTAYTELKIISDADSLTKYNAGEYWQWTTTGTTVTSQPVLKNSSGSAIASPPGTCVVTSVTGLGGDGVWNAICVYSDTDRQEWQVRTPNATYPVLKWSTGDYPSAVTFYQQRLYFGGSNSEPQKIWGSKVGDYENFTIGGLDDDAVEFLIASDNYDPIIHLTSASIAVLPLTYSTEYSLTGGSTAITPHNVLITSQTYYGSSDVIPLRIGSDTLFVQRDGKKLRSIYYDINQSQNQADDMTLFAEHITGTGITDLSYAQEPDSILWAVREDGALLSITYLRDQSVTAWARHNLSGNVKSVGVVPEELSDTVYICNERTVNGVTEFYIEQFGNEFIDSYKVDTDVTPKVTWNGYEHLEGIEVAVLADGFVHPNVTVSNGSITLNDNANEVVVGVPYTNYVKLLHTEVTAGGNTSQGRNTSIDKTVLRFQDTIGSYVTTSNKTTAILPFTLFGEKNFNEKTQVYTGDKELNVTGWSANNTMVVGQQFPLPWTLLAIINRITINDM